MISNQFEANSTGIDIFRMERTYSIYPWDLASIVATVVIIFARPRAPALRPLRQTRFEKLKIILHPRLVRRCSKKKVTVAQDVPRSPVSVPDLGARNAKRNAKVCETALGVHPYFSSGKITNSKHLSSYNACMPCVAKREDRIGTAPRRASPVRSPTILGTLGNSSLLLSRVFFAGDVNDRSSWFVRCTVSSRLFLSLFKQEFSPFHSGFQLSNHY